MSNGAMFLSSDVNFDLTLLGIASRRERAGVYENYEELNYSVTERFAVEVLEVLMVHFKDEIETLKIQFYMGLLDKVLVEYGHKVQLPHHHPLRSRLVGTRPRRQSSSWPGGVKGSPPLPCTRLLLPSDIQTSSILNDVSLALGILQTCINVIFKCENACIDIEATILLNSQCVGSKVDIETIQSTLSGESVGSASVTFGSGITPSPSPLSPSTSRTNSICNGYRVSRKRCKKRTRPMRGFLASQGVSGIGSGTLTLLRGYLEGHASVRGSGPSMDVSSLISRVVQGGSTTGAA